MSKKIDPEAPPGSDLGKRVMDAASAEPIPERIVKLAKELDAALKVKTTDSKDR